MILRSLALVAGAGQTPQIAALSSLLSRFEPQGSGDKPIVSIRFKTNGDLEEATGDTGLPLSYSKVGEWLDSVPPDDSSDWELNVTVDTEDVGDPGTWEGDVRGSFLALSGQRTYSWVKDGLDLGTAESTCTITLRQVSDTGNSVSRSSMTYRVTIEL